MIPLLRANAGMQMARTRRRGIPDGRACHGMMVGPPLYIMKVSFLIVLALVGTLALQGLAHGQADDPPGSRRPGRDLQRGKPKVVPVGQMLDLTSRATVMITPKDRDNFSDEFIYQVSVKNMSAEPFTVESLILVLDKVVDIAGKDSLNRVELGHVEAVGQDGETSEGKPYFKIPLRQNGALPSYEESQRITVRIRNPNYTIVIRPVFRVLGLVHTSVSVGDLIDLLVKKGILTEEDALELMATKQRPAP